MAGADGQRLWDLSRRAASFLRMTRLALTGAAAPPPHMVVEEGVGGCDPCYRSVSTVEDDWESDEDELELLVDDGGDGSRRTIGVSENSICLVCAGHPLSKKPQLTPGAALRSAEDDAAAAAAESSSEPLMPRRAAKRANDAEMAHHPFGCDCRGSETSSLLLVSSS